LLFEADDWPHAARIDPTTVALAALAARRNISRRDMGFRCRESIWGLLLMKNLQHALVQPSGSAEQA
jgi:hypothetical protein